METLKKFDSYSSQVELVEMEGTKYVLKTVDKEESVNERAFLQTMAENNLPSLEVFDKAPLQENQLLLEYIPESEKIDYKNPEEVKAWGAATRKMHDIHFEKPFRITEENQKEYFDWNDFLKEHIENSSSSRMGNKTDLSDEEIQKILEFVKPRLNFNEASYSLLHGDMHDGNTLKRGNDIIIYDKSSEIFAGHYLYDLAIVVGLYPNGLYINSEEPEFENDSKLLEVFVEGYGEDFISEHKDQLDVYMLIRGLDRYPNPFVRVEKEIFNTILGNQA